jgi:CheY-like chemotaxis protein
MTAEKILVVEDNKVAQKCISGILTAAGYEVLTAEDRSTALKLIRTEKPRLITLDIDLSLSSPTDSWDGFTIAAWLKQLKHPAVIVVVSVAKPGPVADKIKAGGIFAYLEKPVQKEALLEVVARGLSQRASEETPAEPSTT